MSDISSYILAKNLPDKDTELFWYGLKDSILNIINKLGDDSKYNHIIKEISEKSQLYNQLQKEKKFQEINYDIEKYLIWISRNLFIQNTDDYDFNIYLSNLKRWSKIIEIPDKIRYLWLENKENNDYFIIYFMIRKYICEHNTNNIKNEETELFQSLMIYINKYDPNPINYNINKMYLDRMYKIILNNKYFKPSLLIEFSKYYQIIKDLQDLDILKKDIPSYWTIDKIFKKGIL
jgi:hypothetical protein